MAHDLTSSAMSAPVTTEVLVPSARPTPATARRSDPPIFVTSLALVGAHSDGRGVLSSEDVLALSDVFQMTGVDTQRVSAEVVDAAHGPFTRVQKPGHSVGNFRPLHVGAVDVAVLDAVMGARVRRPHPAVIRTLNIDFGPKPVGKRSNFPAHAVSVIAGTGDKHGT